ncbi:MAG: trypsin-like peptidase domain-containing protein [Candidatus Kerfeldbacteria bacterium]|nr:trypsin-like peptidase domain-containing protein [Candidatus Kerfeldbacteria bacterium]
MSISQKIALQQVILPVLASTPGKFIHLGSAFVIAALGRQALLMTAAHVIREGAQLDGHRPKHHPSALPQFVNSSNTQTFLRTAKLHVNYREDESKGHLADIVHTYINDPSDIALLAVGFPSHIPEKVLFRSRLSLDSSPPAVGTSIIAAGYGDSKMSIINNSDSDLFVFGFQHKLDYRHGKVIELLGRNDPSFRCGPGFRIDAAISSGMSGGPVLNKNYGDRIVACGINTSDISLSDARDATGSGMRATCQALWPAMAITVEHAGLDGAIRPTRLLELVRLGFVSDFGNPALHVKGVPEPGIKKFSIGWE